MVFKPVVFLFPWKDIIEKHSQILHRQRILLDAFRAVGQKALEFLTVKSPSNGEQEVVDTDG